VKRPATVGAFAVLTPPGRGGIAVVRCLGPAAVRAMEACFRPSGRAASRSPPSLLGAGQAAAPRKRGGEPTDLPAVGRLAYGHFTDAGGRPLDEIILYREAETVFEVNCHGGPAAVEAVCRRLAGLGLEKVDPDRLLALEGAGPSSAMLCACSSRPGRRSPDASSWTNATARSPARLIKF
jgi:hypothetical protein